MRRLRAKLRANASILSFSLFFNIGGGGVNFQRFQQEMCSLLSGRQYINIYIYIYVRSHVCVCVCECSFPRKPKGKPPNMAEIDPNDPNIQYGALGSVSFFFFVETHREAPGCFSRRQDTLPPGRRCGWAFAEMHLGSFSPSLSLLAAIGREPQENPPTGGFL